MIENCLLIVIYLFIFYFNSIQLFDQSHKTFIRRLFQQLVSFSLLPLQPSGFPSADFSAGLTAGPRPGHSRAFRRAWAHVHL